MSVALQCSPSAFGSAFALEAYSYSVALASFLWHITNTTAAEKEFNFGFLSTPASDTTLACPFLDAGPVCALLQCAAGFGQRQIGQTLTEVLSMGFQKGMWAFRGPGFSQGF